jgi:hypothetical protein
VGVVVGVVVVGVVVVVVVDVLVDVVVGVDRHPLMVSHSFSHTLFLSLMVS